MFNLARVLNPICRSAACQTISDAIFDSVNVVTRVVGKIFIGCVFLLTSLVAIYFFYCFLPYQVHFNSVFSVIFHLFTGVYLLINIIFHYYNAVRINPGIVINSAKVDRDQVEHLRENYNYRICKHCAQVKPARTYHCSVCACCILKMEHHCPWINNCVGMFNHKFYLLFCWFLWIGTFYIITSAWPLFAHCYRTPRHRSLEYNAPVQDWMQAYTDGESGKFRTLVIFAWIICLSVFIALGILVVWQSWLISYGETSVERMKLSYERSRHKKLGKVFHSPFDHGFVQNWKNVLGFKDRNEFFWHVLLPSRKRGDDCLENKQYTLSPSDLL